MSLKIVDVPVHRLVDPVIGAAEGLLNIVVVTLHPVPSVYVIVAKPVEIAEIVDPLPIVAIRVLLLLHTPPGMASVKLVVEPTHTLVTPDIAAGNGLMVTDTLP